METRILRIFSANHARVLVLLAIELVIRAIERIFPIRLECQLDNQLTIALFDTVCKALVQIPPCLFYFSVAQELTLRIEDLCILINCFFTSVLLAQGLSLRKLRLLLFSLALFCLELFLDLILHLSLILLSEKFFINSEGFEHTTDLTFDCVEELYCRRYLLSFFLQLLQVCFGKTSNEIQ